MKHYVGKTLLTVYCRIHKIRISKIRNRMYTKQMTAEQAVAMESSQDKLKVIYARSDKLGLSRALINSRITKGKTGEELFVPKQPKYKCFHNGVPLKKLLDESSYNAYFRYLNKNNGDEEIAFKKAYENHLKRQNKTK